MENREAEDTTAVETVGKASSKIEGLRAELKRTHELVILSEVWLWHCTI